MKIVLIATLLLDYVEGALAPIGMDRHQRIPPYGLHLLATVLREAGHEVTVVDLVEQGSASLSEYERDIRDCALVGISATSLSWPSALDCLTAIRRICPATPVVLGGVHATMFDEYILTTFPVTYVVRGEGERALPLLARALQARQDPASVPNLTFMRNGTLTRTELHSPLTGEELGQFPVPDYGSLPLGTYDGLGLESSRGCPFNCVFCSTWHRGCWRGMSPESFLSRVAQVEPYLRETRSGFLHILDDEFSANRERATAIASGLTERALEVPLVFDSRANDLLDERFVRAIVPHASRFLVGAECGYDEGLRRIGKGTTCEALQAAAYMAQRYGLSARCDFSFILGLPWETQEEVLSTVRFACGLYTKYGVRVLLQWHCLIPGSQLWDEAAAVGKVTASFYDNYGFFRDPYLFFAGVPLSPREVWEVSDCLEPVLELARVNDRGERLIEYAVPEPIRLYFNRQSLTKCGRGQALENLEEASRRGRRRAGEK
jgi:radical SAM superfamily enzyme YgiQ (UPF0313 family)